MCISDAFIANFPESLKAIVITQLLSLLDVLQGKYAYTRNAIDMPTVCKYAQHEYVAVKASAIVCMCFVTKVLSCSLDHKHD